MRTVAALLFLALATGCSAPAPGTPPASPPDRPPASDAPASGKWGYAALLERAEKESCDVSGSRKNPEVGPVTAMALEPTEHWVPGQAQKVNWEPNPPGSFEIEIEMRRPGKTEPAYRLHRQAGPSLLGYPEPGCWEITVRTAEKSGTVRVYFAPARPVGLLAARGLPEDRPPDSPTAEWIDHAVGMQVLDAAAANSSAPTHGRKSAALYLLWESSAFRTESPMVYVPATQGAGAQLIMQKSLITGDCHDVNLPYAFEIKPELAREIETRLSSHLVMDESDKAPWSLKAPNCQRFEKA